jgi:hypothetical protein
LQNQHPHFVPSQERKPAPVTITPATPGPQQDQAKAPDTGSRSAYVQGFASPRHRHSVEEDREVAMDVTQIQIPQVLKESKKNLSHSDCHVM